MKNAIAAVQPHVDRAMAPPARRKVLEAGCGSCSHLHLEGAYIVGVDSSEKQLERNNTLDERILGDIQACDLPEGEFDVAVCWYVLEHVPHPQQALENMARALRKDGLLIIAVPSVCSLKGLITKFSPHWFHVLVYRWLLGRKDAGKEDSVPFQTFLRWSIRPTAIERFAGEQGFAVDVLQMFEDYTQNKLRSRYKTFRFAYGILNGVFSWCTRGRVNVYLTDFVAVLRKVGLSVS